MRHFLNLADAGGEAIAAILNDAQDRKAARAGWPKGRADADAPLDGHVLAMIFEKTRPAPGSASTWRCASSAARRSCSKRASSQLGRGETIADTARVLSRFVDAIMIRTDDHAKAEELAAACDRAGDQRPDRPVAPVPDPGRHADRDRAQGASWPGSSWAWLGDGNNVCNSLIEAASLMHFDAARSPVPTGYEPDMRRCAPRRRRAAASIVLIAATPREAVAGAEVVVTDTWASMGQDDSDEYRLAALAPFQVDEALMAAAGARRHVPPLPARAPRRGSHDAVIDGPQSAVWDEAENRLHAQKSLLLWAFGKL